MRELLRRVLAFLNAWTVHEFLNLFRNEAKLGAVLGAAEGAGVGDGPETIEVLSWLERGLFGLGSWTRSGWGALSVETPGARRWPDKGRVWTTREAKAQADLALSAAVHVLALCLDVRGAAVSGPVAERRGEAVRRCLFAYVQALGWIALGSQHGDGGPDLDAAARAGVEGVQALWREAGLTPPAAVGEGASVIALQWLRAWAPDVLEGQDARATTVDVDACPGCGALEAEEHRAGCERGEAGGVCESCGAPEGAPCSAGCGTGGFGAWSGDLGDE
ncbi:uncharacterized protein SOCE26_052600 [Sorangium cellulosum]|uniref:Uncharacterized protein n=1 Tax=Sorangium cellulosum TaxID=56 RepID=A0A2L0EX15_SORCE|nr:hypothetical protein [Sorangium cellulosum]AUX43805.1 uncharacterized protein SOCE26_052600 [Sorangium cellulosum]